MKAEKKVVLIIFLFASILAISLTYILYVKKSNASYYLLSPFSETRQLFSFLGLSQKPKQIIYGYLPYWSIGSGKYLQMDLLTNIAYFGIYINPDGSFRETTVNDQNNVIPEPGYDSWKKDKDLEKIIIKAKKTGVRVALTIIAHTDADTDKFLDCRECWNTLLENTKKELNLKNIKDVNLNFEYAEYTDETKAKQFSEFTKFFNDELDKTYGDSFVVVSAFADSAIKPRVSSDLDNLGRAADGIFIMAYDFHRPTSDNAGPVSPLEGMGVISDYDITTMVKDFLSKIAPNKLIVGFPYYGYNWVVENKEKYAKRLEGNDTTGYSESQVYDRIMSDVATVNATIEWDDSSKVPYYSYVSPETGSTRQVFFENADSLRKKYQLIKSNNLAGVGIWALGYDGDRPELWNVIYDEFVIN